MNETDTNEETKYSIQKSEREKERSNDSSERKQN